MRFFFGFLARETGEEVTVYTNDWGLWMGKCEYCGVTVSGRDTCPLCGRKVRGGTQNAMYPACRTDNREMPEKRDPAGRRS